MIEKYKELIKSLPVSEHGFTSKKETWKSKLKDKDGNKKKELEWISPMINDIFGENDVITITRSDLKSSCSNIDVYFFLKTIFWGYSTGMRGNNFEFLFQKEQMEKMIKLFKENPKIDNFKLFYEKTKEIKGLGISTITKFLYFLEIPIMEKKALILDEQIMKALSESIFKYKDFESLERRNAHEQYQHYLNTMDCLAKKMGTQPENIEMFLFLFHNILHQKK